MSWMQFIFPNRCRFCIRILDDTKALLCVKCISTLPFTYDKMDKKSILYKKLVSLCHIEKAAALLNYNNKNITKALLHHNKYYGQDYIGAMLADLYNPIHNKESYTAVLPVPSHQRSIRKRGYNQIDRFALKIAEKCNSPYNKTLLIRTKRKTSQAGKNRTRRLRSLQKSFLFKSKFQKPKHFLLVDDVCTTGATLRSCVDAIQKNIPHKISVLTMASVN